MLGFLAPYKLYLALVGFLGAAFIGGYVTHKFDNSRFLALELKYAAAEKEAIAKAASIQKTQDAIATDAAVKAAAGQIQIVKQQVIVEKRITEYVTDHSDCITLGLIRVLDAAVLGADPADLALAAGQLNDACAPISATDLARNIAGNYAIARGNAQQLDDLISTVRKLDAVQH